jgi:hypothetical protein
MTVFGLVLAIVCKFNFINQKDKEDDHESESESDGEDSEDEYHDEGV